MRAMPAIAVIAAFLTLMGCAPTDEQEPEFKRLKLSDLRSTVAAPTTQPDRATPAAIVEQLDLAIDAPIDEAWRLASDEGLDPAFLAVWRSNGLRAGTIPLASYLDFVSVLPARRGVQASTFITQDEFIPLGFSPPTEEALTLAFALPGEDAHHPRTRIAVPGLFQFLARVTEWSPGTGTPGVPGLRVDLTPHHYFPQPTLRIRDGLELRRDGWTPPELTLIARLAADRLLVLAMDRLPPPKPAPPRRRAAASQPAATQTADANQRSSGDDESGFAEHPRLGDLILRSKRLGRPVQVVVIVGLLPRAATQPDR